jgi:ribosomal protein L37AE/L43A
MNSRTCPECASIWYSADTFGVWICPGCGAEIHPAEDDSENTGQE